LKELGITLPERDEPFGTYVEAVQTGNVLFLTGILPAEGRGSETYWRSQKGDQN
jgi:enamine deaminase RidA (YjgF/YER057c/UK114 family)